MYCQHCGQEIPDNAEYCSRCGSPVRRDRDRRSSSRRDSKPDPMDLLKYKSTTTGPAMNGQHEQDERNQRVNSSLMMKVALGFVIVVLALSLLSR